MSDPRKLCLGYFALVLVCAVSMYAVHREYRQGVGAELQEIESNEHSQALMESHEALSDRSTFLCAIIVVLAGGVSAVWGWVWVRSRRLSQRQLEEYFRRRLEGLEGSQEYAAFGSDAPLVETFENRFGAILALLSEFESKTTTLMNCSTEISGSANELATTAETATEQASRIAEASRAMKSGLDQVVIEASQSKASAEQAAGMVSSSSTKTELLRSASAEIGEVIEVIQGIAEQTNLLALNATIESARAGDSGKGFAVVANEVKELSKQTASATDGIREKIAQIQTATSEMINAIESIGASVRSLNDRSSTIVGSLDSQAEQTSVVVDAAANLVEINQKASNGASQAQLSGGELARLAEHLSARLHEVGTTTDNGESALRSDHFAWVAKLHNLVRSQIDSPLNRILVVDDDPAIVKLVQVRLKKSGLESDGVTSAAEALRLMRKQPYRVIVSDVDMPGINGIEMVSAMKSHNPLVQIVMLTAATSLEQMVECVDRGAVDFFSKTDDLTSVVELVNEALSRYERWIAWMQAQDMVPELVGPNYS